MLKRQFALPKKHTQIVELFLYQDKNKYWCFGGKDKNGLEYMLPLWVKNKNYGKQKEVFIVKRSNLKYYGLFYLEEDERFLPPVASSPIYAVRSSFYFISGFKEKGDWK